MIENAATCAASFKNLSIRFESGQNCTMITNEEKVKYAKIFVEEMRKSFL